MTLIVTNGEYFVTDGMASSLRHSVASLPKVRRVGDDLIIGNAGCILTNFHYRQMYKELQMLQANLPYEAYMDIADRLKKKINNFFRNDINNTALLLAMRGGLIGTFDISPDPDVPTSIDLRDAHECSRMPMAVGGGYRDFFGYWKQTSDFLGAAKDAISHANGCGISMLAYDIRGFMEKQQ